MQEGFFAGDELWLWVDSWASKSTKSNIISQILLKSRKRDITIAYTTQGISQINKRIRDISDFIAYPLISLDNSYCRLEVFRGPQPSITSRIKPSLYFNCEPVYALFNTYEEIRGNIENNEEEEFKEIFLPVSQNLAFRKYLMKEKGLVSEVQIEKYCEKIERMLNPDGIKEGVREV